MHYKYIQAIKRYYPEAHFRRQKYGGFGVYLHSDSTDDESVCAERTRPGAGKRAYHILVHEGSMPYVLGCEGD